ncbi:MAG: LLM class flavin-dependent oxidoreductase [Chloroflexi bacterium]|nr:LLM class flavin-dependent oxidoreductase [Chloroflexota bacterium]
MLFDTFHLPYSPSPDDDHRVLTEQIEQIVEAERLGFDTAWLTEHNFTGECAFGDPLIFGAALSQRTTRIRVGFAVLQMALHHPTRLLIQTSQLDNLLGGRLTIGIGRGSSFNQFEYAGFGVDTEGQRERMFEAIELMERSWAGDYSPFEGEHFRVQVHGVRPAPIQRPHPPIALSSLSDDSLLWAAGRGYPVLLPRLEVGRARERIAFFAQAIREAGHDEAAVDRALDHCAVTRSIHLADSDEEARAAAAPATARANAARAASRMLNTTSISAPMEAWKAPGAAPAAVEAAEGVSSVIQRTYILGTPETACEQLAELADAGVRRVMLAFSWGDLEHERVLESMRRFTAEVMPRLGAPGRPAAAR